MWKVVLLALFAVSKNDVSGLKIYNYIISKGQPYNLTNINYPKQFGNRHETLEYNFVADGSDNAQLKIVCDKIKISQISKNTDCENVYFSRIDGQDEHKICDENIENFVYKTTNRKLQIKIKTTSDGSISYKCTVFNNVEPVPEIIKLHPNGRAVTIGELPEPVPYFDHLWEFQSPIGTRISFQCVVGMIGIKPICGKNVFTFDDGEKVTEYCESDYLVIFSKSNLGRVRVQLDEAGDGYFECIVQAVTGPHANEYENAVSVEIDSSEHGIVPGIRRTSCKCGWANKSGARIVNGTETGINEFPWMAYLEVKHEVDKQVWNSTCGASVVTPRHILTAAHCLVSSGSTVVKPENVKIILGKHNSDISIKYERRVSGQKIFIGELFHKEGISHHDIALILTRQTIEFNNLIGPICLEPEELPIINRRIIIMGWGVTEDGTASKYLRKSRARVMDPTVCGGNIWDVCTKTSPSATCSGDSGGPLVWLDPETNRYVQVSLVSRGHDDCKTTASISTLIAHFYDWIQEIIKSTDPSVATCGKI
uniref:Venom S1 protease 28 n=1 Tax=Oncocephalus sp. TaxID=2944721 RepID=A0AB38ZEM6_9HEMI